MRPDKRWTKGGHGMGKIKDMVMISKRPAEVEDRAVPGHWECDLILGKGFTWVGTLVERQTRHVILLKLPKGHGAEAVREAMSKRSVTLPAQLRRSLTWDQGPEMSEHVRLSVDTGVEVYFCDPRSPWQRGTNENTKGRFANISRKALIYRSTTNDSSKASPGNSTAGLARPSALCHHRRRSPKPLCRSIESASDRGHPVLARSCSRETAPRHHPGG